MNSHQSHLIELGNLSATPGTRPWAVALRMELLRLLDSAEVDHDGLNDFLDVFSRHEGWKALESSGGKPYATFQEFCLDRRPNGLQVTREMVSKWCAMFDWAKGSQAMAADPEVQPLAEDHRPQKGNNVTLPTVDDARGNRAEYLIRRLKRDRPDLAEKLARGEFPSARAAAIEAGIVKVPTALETANRAAKRLSEAELLAHLRAIWADASAELQRRFAESISWK